MPAHVERRVPGPGLRGRLLLLTLPVVNLAFVVIWFLATATSRESLVALADANLETGGAGLAEAISQTLRDAHADAATTARLDITAAAIESNDPKNVAWLADELVRSRQRYAALVVTDARGQVVAANTRGRGGQELAGLLGRSVTHEPWGAALVGLRKRDVAWVPLGRPALLEGVLGPREQVAGVGLPVMDVVGDRIGAVTVFVSSAYLGELLERFLTEHGGAVDSLAVLTDQAGRLVVLPRRLSGHAEWSAPGLDIPAAQKGVRQPWTGPRGAEFLYTQSAVRTDGPFAWNVTAMKTVATLLAPVRRMSSRLLVAFAAGIAVTSLVLLVLATRFVRPIRRLTEAAARTGRASDFDPIPIETSDEIGVLTSAYNRMLADLKDNQLRLEVKVEERTAALRNRNRDMRLVLDNVELGLVTVSVSGHLAQERSAVIDAWFEPYEGEVLFVDYIARIDPDFAARFRLGYEAVLEDVLPRDICLEQMPRRFRHGAREFSCSYFPITEGDELKGLLIVIDDISEELLRALREAERKELLAVFEALTRDRGGFLTFLEEAEDLFARLAHARELEVARRIVHTLKGNAQNVGLTVLGELCHKVEDEMAESNGPASAITRAALERRWRELKEFTQTLLGEGGRDSIELNVKELEKLVSELRDGLAPAEVLDRVSSWQLEPVERPLRRLGAAAATLARRLGKGELEIHVEGHGVRLDPKRWGSLWAELVHVVRNAVDHGIETPEVRRARGKSARPGLRLAANTRGRRLVIEIEDNGAGIDWSAVRAAAERRGLVAARQEDLVDCLFAPGFTTRKHASHVSGRGIGLAAVRSRIGELGGSIAVDSRAGEGTTFRCELPLLGIGPRYGVTTPSVPSCL